MLACSASRVSNQAARTTRSEIEISSIRLIIRADALYALRYCSMAKRIVSRQRAGPLHRAHLALEEVGPDRVTTAMKISRFDLKCT